MANWRRALIYNGIFCFNILEFYIFKGNIDITYNYKWQGQHQIHENINTPCN